MFMRYALKSVNINLDGRYRPESKMLLLLLILVLSTWADERSCLNECFYETEEACPQHNDTYKCQISKHCNNSLICCHLTADNIITVLRDTQNKNKIQKLHLRNVTVKSFDISWLNPWRVSSLAITDGKINKIQGHFPKFVKSRCLNFSSNGILEFDNMSLKHVQNLSIFDLSRNNLSHIPPLKLGINLTLDISDNKALQCNNLIDTMKRYRITFINANETTCLASSTFSWFNSTEYVSLTKVEKFYELKKNCTPTNCSCEARRWDFSVGQEATLVMMVDCAGRQLTSLPFPLPANTIALNISNNNITSLDAISDISYGNLRELYADHNKISSILPLLDSPKFISGFLALSLRYNELKTVPTYVLFNIFDRNDHFRYLNLGQNKLECDCNTAKVLKVWLLNKQAHITDFDEIYCSNMDFKVVELDPNKLCKTEQDWTDYIYYIITAEIFLLLLLVGKVSYDYWVFKTAGYLPWPASKMPKLPCDWLCE